MANERHSIEAAALRDSVSTRRPVAPLRERVAGLDVEAAYRIQDINTRHAIASGRRLVGRKIGLTSQAVQRQLGVDQPDYGMLFEDMRVETGGTVPLAKLIQPKIEGEIAFVLGKDVLDANCTTAQLADAVDYAVAALEIVDSRIEGWRIGLVDTIADNASSAMFVIGSSRVSLEGIDLPACTMQLHANGQLVSQGAGRECLGSPLHSALWLARKMVEVGRPLKAADIVLTGALGPMVVIAPNTHYRLEVDGLGSVDVISGAAA